MEELDTFEPDKAIHSADSEHELLLDHVYQEDHEIMYLDTYLSELFSKETE